MFNSDEDFEDHVLVVFSFSDKSPVDNEPEWLEELCSPGPVPQSISFSKDSTQAELLDLILIGDLPYCQLRSGLDISRLLKESDKSENTENINFLINQIMEARSALQGGKLNDVPEDILNGAHNNLRKYDEEV